MVAAVALDRAEDLRFHDEQRMAVVELASGKRALLEAQLNARLHVINGLTALVRREPNLSADDFGAFAASLVEGLPGIRSVQLAPGAVIRHVWPVEGNRQAIGHDLLADPVRREATQRTIEGRRLMVAGPYQLLQGGLGMVVRQPIFLVKAGREEFWGLATVVLDVPPLLESAGLTWDETVRFALRGKDGLGAAGEVFHGDAGLFSRHAVLMDITLPNGTWQLGGEPAKGWADHRPGRIGFIILAGVAALSVALMADRLLRDLARRRQAEAEAVRNLAASKALGNILRQALTARPLDQILGDALDEILAQDWLKLERRGSIFLTDADGPRLRMAVYKGLPDPICASCQTVAFGTCLCGRAAATGAVVFAAHVDAHHETGFAGQEDHGHYCVPIRNHGGLLGVLNTYVSAGHRHCREEERFLGMAADTLAGIIERRRAEQARHESEELARALMNASADAALLLDRTGVVLAGNDALAARCAKTLADVRGRLFFDLLPEDVRTEYRRQFAEIIETGQPLHIRDDRQTLSLDNRFYPIRDESGAVRQVAVFSRDVTEQRKAALAMDKALDDLARSNDELQQFAYVASHDLRQPLRMVSSYLTLIERKLGRDIGADLKDYLGFAVNGAKRMDRLILDLLDYSRVGRDGPPGEVLDLREVIDDALLNLAPAIAEAAAEVVVHDPLPVVLGDRSELTRLFQNLIGNAVKYRAPGRSPRIEVECRDDGAGWLFSVRDNGIGIAADGLDRVFGVFQRLVPAEAYEGTGIGLAVCKKIVEHHGGRIWVESEPDFGATFLFFLPRA